MSSAAEVRDRAASQMEAWARDNTHGYDQQYRWGERGDFDCSSAVISAYELAGVPVKTFGATYTGNMYDVFLRCDFKDVTGEVNMSNGGSMIRGDVLLNKRNHTAIYLGGSQIAEASINEFGGTTGGQPGDQTGREFKITNYRNYPWDCVLRYVGTEKDTSSKPANVPSGNPIISDEIPRTIDMKLPVLKRGMGGNFVAALQGVLHSQKYSLGPYGVDGDFGVATLSAVRNFQIRNGLDPDGIVGESTWKELFK